MVELVEVLHVPKDDVLLVDNSSGNLLHAAGHLPQVRLQKDTSEKVRILKQMCACVCPSEHPHPDTPVGP